MRTSLPGSPTIRHRFPSTCRRAQARKAGIFVGTTEDQNSHITFDALFFAIVATTRRASAAHTLGPATTSIAISASLGANALAQPAADTPWPADTTLPPKDGLKVIDLRGDGL